MQLTLEQYIIPQHSLSPATLCITPALHYFVILGPADSCTNHGSVGELCSEVSYAFNLWLEYQRGISFVWWALLNRVGKHWLVVLTKIHWKHGNPILNRLRKKITVPIVPYTRPHSQGPLYLSSWTLYDNFVFLCSIILIFYVVHFNFRSLELYSFWLLFLTYI